MVKKTLAIAIIVLVYNFFFFPLHVPSSGRLDFLMLIATTLAAVWLMFWPKKWRLKEKSAACISGIALGGVVLSLYHASQIDQRLIGVVTILLTMNVIYLLILDHQLWGGLIEMIVAPLRVFFAWLPQLFVHYGNADNFKPSPKLESARIHAQRYIPTAQTSTKIIRGLFITLPIAVFVLLLLERADPIFAKTVSNLFGNFSFSIELIQRLAYSVGLILFLIPSAYTHIKERFSSPTGSKKWANFTIETTIIAGSLVLILGMFVIIQFRYLFATVAETELQKFGIPNYSEYVRKGFIELLIVTAITYLVSSLSYLVFRAGSVAKTKLHTLRLLNTVLLTETGLFIISIIRRVWLYQSDHGLTRIRIYGMTFILYVLCLVVLLGIRFYKTHKKPWYIAELGLGIIILMATIWWKPDYRIATQFKPTVNNEIDYVYIARLSADALPGWLEAYQHSKDVLVSAPSIQLAQPEDVRKVIYAYRISQQLTTNYAHLVLRYGDLEEYKKLYYFDTDSAAELLFSLHGQRGWKETNLAEKMAYQQLKKAIQPTEIRSLEAELKNYLDSIPLEKTPSQLDRSFESPLL